jgi:hypothetical protein
MNSTISLANGIKKLQVQATIEFAISNIPGADRNTLEKLSDLINATGNFGPISEAEIIAKMNLILKYIPGASEWALRAVAELLNIHFPQPAAAVAQPQKMGVIVPTPLVEPSFAQAARLH